MIKQVNAIHNSIVTNLDISSLKAGSKETSSKETSSKETSSKEAGSKEISDLESIDYVAAQAQLAKTMRHVCENGAPIAIDGMGKDKVVLMPLEHFQKLSKNLS